MKVVACAHLAPAPRSGSPPRRLYMAAGGFEAMKAPRRQGRQNLFLTGHDSNRHYSTALKDHTPEHAALAIRTTDAGLPSQAFAARQAWSF